MPTIPPTNTLISAKLPSPEPNALRLEVLQTLKGLLVELLSPPTSVRQLPQLQALTLPNTANALLTTPVRLLDPEQPEQPLALRVMLRSTVPLPPGVLLDLKPQQGTWQILQARPAATITQTPIDPLTPSQTKGLSSASPLHGLLNNWERLRVSDQPLPRSFSSLALLQRFAPEPVRQQIDCVLQLAPPRASLIDPKQLPQVLRALGLDHEANTTSLPKASATSIPSAQTSTSPAIIAALTESDASAARQTVATEPSSPANLKGELLALWQLLRQELRSQSLPNSGNIHYTEGRHSQGLLPQLLGWTVGALSRIQLNQLASLPAREEELSGTKASAQWLWEIPQSQTWNHWIQLWVQRFDLPNEKDSTKLASTLQRRWRVELFFDFQEHGRFKAQVQYQAPNVELDLLAQEPKTLQWLQQTLPDLRLDLQNAGLRVEAIQARSAPVQPIIPAESARQQLEQDRGTRV